ncbi:hypothetical protein PIB30_077403 [Stylosanthes scabra]|uniref:Uncharacterized protein n=1 Tax=Stylosanthes scabra TaxID=79078 RepID=A0ABU6RQM7_9FABA|nr:hypothetical protein [Stylosanthes scabra]
MTQSANKGREDALLSQPLSNQWRSIPTLSLCINQEGREDALLSQPLSNQWGSIPTLFLCANQEEREDALLQEEDVESLNHGEVHECIEEVEEENEDKEVEDVDQEVEDKDKEPKGMENVHSASSEATPPKLPSELHFEWVNPSNMNFLGPQHYGLLETDGQLKALCGVLDKKKMESMELDESRFKAYSGLLHKLHNNRAKVGALSLRKYLGPW